MPLVILSSVLILEVVYYIRIVLNEYLKVKIEIKKLFKKIK